MNALSHLPRLLGPLADAPVALILLARLTAFLLLVWGAHAAFAGRNPRWRVALCARRPLGSGRSPPFLLHRPSSRGKSSEAISQLSSAK